VKQLDSIISNAIHNHGREQCSEVGLEIEPDAKEVGPRLYLTQSATQENEGQSMLVTMRHEGFIERESPLGGGTTGRQWPHQA
jgi:hypothetical protein